jgi:hypothetical protein
MKSKEEQRKKGVNPLFFRNNAHGKMTLQETTTLEIVGQNSWQQPM